MFKRKVGFFDRSVRREASRRIAAVASVVSFLFLFVEIPSGCKVFAGVAFLVILLLIYFFIWVGSNCLKGVSIRIEGTDVDIRTGDIFEFDGLKVIPFNEYFDSIVDERLISSSTINGKFIKKFFANDLSVLGDHITRFRFDSDSVVEEGVVRDLGKNVRYRLGSICVWNDYLLTAFSRFDSNNVATLTMPEYLEFLINFWDRVNRVYAQRSVAVPVFGSGITRIKGHRGIEDEDLLKIMLWTFRISEMRFSYPARLTIIVHPEKIDKINLLDISMVRNGV